MKNVKENLYQYFFPELLVLKYIKLQVDFSCARTQSYLVAQSLTDCDVCVCVCVCEYNGTKNIETRF
jgi:hypothetical protein